MPPTLPTRRSLLFRLGGGLGGLALASLLNTDHLLAATAPPRPPRVKRIIQLFMNGGVSQMDTFLHRPTLDRLHGQPFDPGAGVKVESVTGSHAKFPLMKSPFPFQQHGQSGHWISSVFPHLASIADELTFLHSMASKTNVHGPGSYMMNTGFTLPGFPAMGAWISYALGNLSDNLPSFVVLPDARGLPYNNLGNFSAGFLPAAHAATLVKPSAKHPIAHLHPPESIKYITKQSEQDALALLREMNEEHLARHPGDSRLDARIASYELAARMQLSAPELLDTNAESESTRTLYGLNEKHTNDFGHRCLVARRMLERGVRFVQVWSGAGGPANNWDNHGNIPTELPAIARQVDKPTAALLIDLKRRGLLEDTLVVFSTEFGRQPFTQGSAGRDHNGGACTTWLAGAGIKPGLAHGDTDEWGWRAIDPLYSYDLHATVLHLLGLDHEKLTFRHNGADRRLTDVHGHVITPILA